MRDRVYNHWITRFEDTNMFGNAPDVDTTVHEGCKYYEKSECCVDCPIKESRQENTKQK